MSVVSLNLAAAGIGSATRTGSTPGAEASDPAAGSSRFERLIGGARPAAAGKTAKAESADAKADADATPENAAAGAASAESSAKPSREEHAVDNPTADAKPAAAGDGSAVLAWLQAGAVGAIPTPTPAGADFAAVAAGLASGPGPGLPAATLKLMVNSAAALVSGTRNAADGLATTIGADTADGSAIGMPAFSLANLVSGNPHDAAKAAVPTLEALQAAMLNAGTGEVVTPAAPSANAAALLAGGAAAVAAHVQPAVAIADAGLPPALQSPLNAQSRELPQQIGERVQWLVGAGVQEARLQLHPRDLGSITVQVRMEAGSASVFFGAEHPAARAALEAALPQLREQFASGGMQLAQAQVSSQSNGWNFGGSQTSGNAGGGRASGSGLPGGEGDESPVAAIATRVVHLGLLDDYA